MNFTGHFTLAWIQLSIRIVSLNFQYMYHIENIKNRLYNIKYIN